MPARKKYDTEEERKEAARASRRKWKDKNSDAVKARKAVDNRRYREKNADKIAPQRAAYREKNRDAIRAKCNERYRAVPEKYVYTSIKNRCARNDIPFDLTPEFIASITPEFCPILGIKLERGREPGAKGISDFAPSVDRIIPAIGYLKTNVIVISQRANRIKNDATVDELMKVATFYRDILEARG